jgi:hypothetical protein
VSRRQQQEERLLASGPFNPDLYGYAAVAAAAELVSHWEDCEKGGTPLDEQTRRRDVDETIAALKEWRRSL